MAEGILNTLRMKILSNDLQYVFKLITRVAQDYHEFAIVQNALAEIADELRRYDQ